jgi:hypothetical protein
LLNFQQTGTYWPTNSPSRHHLDDPQVPMRVLDKSDASRMAMDPMFSKRRLEVLRTARNLRERKEEKLVLNKNNSVQRQRREPTEQHTDTTSTS